MIDRTALDSHLSAIGWTFDRLESLIDVTPANKQTIWRLIKPDAANVRAAVTTVKAIFTNAKVLRIT